MTILLEKELRLTPADNEQLIGLDVTLPADYEALEICYDYAPKWLSDRSEARRLIEEGMDRYGLDRRETDWESFLPLGNMITLSLEREGEFVGAAHRHHPQQRLVLSEGWASPGLPRRKPRAGQWRVVVCTNAVVSAEVDYRLTVRGLTKEEFLPYRCLELHTHTVHSDGGATVEELCQEALAWGYEGIALTDHNTWSGTEELTPALAAKTLPAARGIEWTTLYGHFLVIGGEGRVDCRYIRRDDIDTYLARIQEEGSAVGIAHPCDVGAPFCNGCDWRFEVTRWELVDYIEIWNGPFPLTKAPSRCAFRKWTKLLNQGYHIGVSSGRDWHLLEDEPERPHLGVTYLGIEGPIDTASVTAALKAGRSYVTAGPMLDLFLERDGRRYQLGDTAPAGPAWVYGRVDVSARRRHWEGFGLLPRRLALTGPGGVLASAPLEGAGLLWRQADLPQGWVRLELYGDFNGAEDCLLGVTSPIYIG